jgi:hypothetical protein
MSNRLVVSTRKGFFILNNSGGKWAVERTSFLGQNVVLSMYDPRDNSILVALHHGHFGEKLHRSTDGGATWTEQPSPVYPQGETISVGDGKPPAPASLKQIWALEPGSKAQKGRIWAGTAPGGLFRSDDNGQTWELVRGLWDREERKQWFGGGTEFVALHSICIDPRDDKVIRVAISCGGVQQSNDDGATWAAAAKGMRADFMPPELQYNENIQDPHHMVQSPSSPDILWVQHHNGVFKSEDGSKNWSELKDIKPSVFGFGVAVHPKDGNTAWFVPGVKDETRIPVDGKLVVTRTRDGGKTFDVLRKGLPQEHCYDLIFRHALDVDGTGDRVAMGSTTGGLWISEDQGDSWKTFSTSLPPIHAVEFA